MRAVTMFEGSILMRTGNWSLPEIITITLTPPPSDITISSEEVTFTAQITASGELQLMVSLEVEWTSPNITESNIQRRKRQADSTMTTFRVAIGTEPIDTFGELPEDTNVMNLEVRLYICNYVMCKTVKAMYQCL